MCGSMVDIQSAATENRRKKKKEEETTATKYNVCISATQGGHKNRGAQKKRSSHKVCGVTKARRESMVGKICERSRF